MLDRKQGAGRQGNALLLGLGEGRLTCLLRRLELRLTANLLAGTAPIEVADEKAIVEAVFRFPGVQSQAEVDPVAVFVADQDPHPLRHRPGIAGIAPFEVHAPGNVDHAAAATQGRELHAVDRTVRQDLNPFGGGNGRRCRPKHKAGEEQAADSRRWRHEAGSLVQ